MCVIFGSRRRSDSPEGKLFRPRLYRYGFTVHTAVSGCRILFCCLLPPAGKTCVFSLRFGLLQPSTRGLRITHFIHSVVLLHRAGCSGNLGTKSPCNCLWHTPISLLYIRQRIMLLWSAAVSRPHARIHASKNRKAICFRLPYRIIPQFELQL